MSWISYLQWPAMLVTIAASWLTGSTSKSRRQWGFWVFLASNILWVVWAWFAHAWALIVLQVFLVVMNVRGVRKNDPA
jgi:hypothetical protein